LKTESALSAAAWETMYAPYDQATYQSVVDCLSADDIILDIGAGDLRLSRQMARIARKVYAIEINVRLLDQVNAAREPLPANLSPICGDARALDFPADITIGVLMMRHCTCFEFYVHKLRNAGAARLITNARWRMSVEVVDLLVTRQPIAEAEKGWYACVCGGTGFKEGSLEHWTFEMDRMIHEVSSCPHCI
jgi:hypothetical protein